jgi:hypothetical protein
MKFRFLLLILSVIVILSTAFTSTTKATDKPNNNLKVWKEIVTPTGVNRVVIAELSNYTEQEREVFIQKVLKANKIKTFNCFECTKWRGDEQGSGWCSRWCCYPGPSGCLTGWTETAECCAIPPDEPGC